MSLAMLAVATHLVGSSYILVNTSGRAFLPATCCRDRQLSVVDCLQLTDQPGAQSHIMYSNDIGNVLTTHMRTMESTFVHICILVYIYTLKFQMGDCT